MTTESRSDFDFSSDESPVTYECSIDGDGFVPCSNPFTTPSLSEGTHTLAVRAVDAAGNRDPSPATYEWTIDRTPPETTITSGPDSPTAATDAGFTYTGGDTYECSLDGAAFAPCGPTFSADTLDEGSHALRFAPSMKWAMSTPRRRSTNG